MYAKIYWNEILYTKGQTNRSKIFSNFFAVRMNMWSRNNIIYDHLVAENIKFSLSTKYKLWRSVFLRYLKGLNDVPYILAKLMATITFSLNSTNWDWNNPLHQKQCCDYLKMIIIVGIIRLRQLIVAKRIFSLAIVKIKKNITLHL